VVVVRGGTYDHAHPNEFFEFQRFLYSIDFFLKDGLFVVVQ
jgi:hypothetical protein